MNEVTKKCTGCNKTLAISQFNDSPNGKDFKKSRCKSCESDYYKGYYHRKKEEFKNYKNDLTYLKTNGIKIVIEGNRVNG